MPLLGRHLGDFGLPEQRRILVTGAAGHIGAECCRQLYVLSPKQLILVDQSEQGIRQIEF